MVKLQNTEHQSIPVYIKEEYFNEFILPLLWKGRRGPRSKLSYFKLFHYILYVLYTGMQWKMLPVDCDDSGQPEINYTNGYRKWRQWVEQGSIQAIFEQSVRCLHRQGAIDVSMLSGDGSNVVAKKGGELIGYSGHKHQTGDKVVALFDRCGHVLAPMTVAPVNEADMSLLPEALEDLKRVLTRTAIPLAKRTLLNLDAGFDSKSNRKAVFNAGLKPNIKENPRNRKHPKRGRPRHFDAEAYKERFASERTFGWADKFRRVLVRYDWYIETYQAFHLLAFSLINFGDIWK